MSDEAESRAFLKERPFSKAKRRHMRRASIIAVVMAMAAVLGVPSGAGAGPPTGTIAFEHWASPAQLWSPGVSWPNEAQDIVALSMADGRQWPITSGGLRSWELRPKWSPDGQHIAYHNGAGIFIVDRRGKVIGRIRDVGDTHVSNPAWSPDGDRLAFVHYDPNRGPDGMYRIATSRLDGSDFRFITVGRLDFDPAWSPDGRWIAFAGRRDQGPLREWHLYVVRPDGTHLRRLTTGKLAVEDPEWSPDGRFIAHNGMIEENLLPAGRDRAGVFLYDYDLFVTDLKGRSRRVAGEPGVAEGWPCWSPDGSLIAFSRFRAGHEWTHPPLFTYNAWEALADLYTVTPDGSNLTQLTNTPQVNEMGCDWSGV